jgi:hypothetical protein
MATASVATVEELIVTEDWELARQVLVEAPELYDYRREIEAEFEIDLTNLGSIIDLPDALLSPLKLRLLTQVESWVYQFNDRLYQKVCVEWNYCARKDSGMVLIVEALISVLDIAITKGYFVLTVLLLKRGYFDKLCRCGSRGITSFNQDACKALSAVQM